jgi:nucleoid DNA-binding protein
MANLTKREIVVRISNDTGMVQHQVFEVVQRTLDLITDSLARGEDVELRNFGIFEVRQKVAKLSPVLKQAEMVKSGSVSPANH